MLDNNPPVWIITIEKLINQALSLDEETLHALSGLEGKILAFEFNKIDLTIYLFPSGTGLSINTLVQDKPDVLIKGTPSNFIMMLAASKQGTASLPTNMQVTGDIGLAQRFQEIMQNIEIDFEEPLSKWLGDSAAYQIGKFVRGTGRFANNTGKTLAMDLSEYLRFEINMLPDDLLVDEFCKNVDVLREDVERFEQRIKKLEQQVNNKFQDNE